MYKKFFVNQKKDSYEKNLLIIKDEMGKSFRVEINYIAKEQNKIRTEILESEKSFEELKSLLDVIVEQNDYFILTFYYIKKQNVTKRTLWKDKSSKELLAELIAVFDKRKINNCFNYNLTMGEKNEIINQVIEEYNKNIREKLKKYLEVLVEIDEKLYKNESLKNLAHLSIKLKNLESDLVANEETKEILEKVSQKYELIDICDYSTLEMNYPPNFSRLNIEFVLKNETLERIILDETYEETYKILKEKFSQWLKKILGKGFTTEKVKSFQEYVKKYNLKKMIDKRRNKIKSNINIEISPSDWKEIENVLNNDIDFIKSIIFLDDEKVVSREWRYKLKILNILIKKSKNKKKVNFKKEILRLYFLGKYNYFSLRCKIELNKNEYSEMNFTIRGLPEERKERKLSKEIKEYIKNIEDIIEDGKNTDKDFFNEGYVPNKIYDIFKSKENEILNILYDVKNLKTNNEKKLNEVLKKIKNEIINIVDNEEVIEIKLEKLVDQVFEYDSFLEKVIQLHLDIEEIKIKNEIIKKRIKDSKK